MSQCMELREGMDMEEQKVLTFLCQNREEWVKWFLYYSTSARQRILHRLLQALIRENLGDGQIICEEDRIHFQITTTDTISFRAKQLSFDRFQLLGKVTLENDLTKKVIDHPVELLECLAKTKKYGNKRDKRFNRFYEEIQNSVSNYALSLAAARIKRDLLKEKETEHNNCLDWVCAKKEKDPTFSPLIFFEQLVVDGHPIHPGAKIKMGLDVEDVVSYSPEFGAMPGLVPILVQTQECKLSTIDGTTSSRILFEEYKGLREKCTKELDEQGLDLKDYELIPVHPWQYKNIIQTLFSEEIEAKKVVPIISYRIPTAALMSLRTVAPIQKKDQNKHHIKTAMKVQTTGTIRTISPQSANNGPYISQLLNEVQKRECFNHTFVIAKEHVGIFFNSTQSQTKEARVEKNKNLVAVYRENIEKYTHKNEVAMPGSSLLAVSPFSEKPIVGELIEKFRLYNGIKTLEDASIQFITHYAQIALPGFITLLCRYGISLEGHLQNSVPVFFNGKPIRMIVRDFGGVRLLRKRLKSQDLEVSLYPGSVTITDDEIDVQNKTFYPVIQNHFGELILNIAEWCEIEESELWKPVRKVLNQVFTELEKDPTICDQVQRDKEALFSSQMDLKAMTTMRLLGDITRYTFSKVSNPLSSFNA